MELLYSKERNEKYIRKTFTLGEFAKLLEINSIKIRFLIMMKSIYLSRQRSL